MELFYLGFTRCTTRDDIDYGQCDTKIESTLFVSQMDFMLNRFNSISSSHR